MKLSEKILFSQQLLLKYKFNLIFKTIKIKLHCLQVDKQFFRLFNKYEGKK